MDQKFPDNIKGSSTMQDASNVAFVPPPYSEKPPPQTSDSQSYCPGQASGFPEYPPQAHHTQAPARTFHVNYKNWRCDRIRVMDTDDEHSTPLYNVRLGITKPQMTIEAASTETKIATVVFHTFHTRIDTVIHDTPITLTTHLSTQSAYAYSSPALQGATLTWKSRNATFDLVCLDEKGVTMARFHFSQWSMKKCGRLEIMDAAAQDDAVAEEIMVTGLAFAYYIQTMRIAIFAH